MRQEAYQKPFWHYYDTAEKLIEEFYLESKRKKLCLRINSGGRYAFHKLVHTWKGRLRQFAFPYTTQQYRVAEEELTSRMLTTKDVRQGQTD